MNPNKSYFFQSFLILLLSACIFLGLKKVLPNKIFSEKAGTTKNVLIDSMLIDAFQSQKEASTATIGDTIPNQDVVFVDNNGVTFPDENFDDYRGNQYLIPFYEKLFQLETNKTGNVRIAYFGDSMTDGDMIVQDVRIPFQAKFGGQGVGFVAITSESASSRSSIQHEFSPNWKMQSYLNVRNPIRSFGVNGHVFFANDTVHLPWVQYKSSRVLSGSKLYNPTLFYGSSENENGQISYIIGKDTLHKKLVANNLLNTISISPNSLKALKINFKNARSVPIYGFNFDDGKGIHVDNFSQRGNSGIPISNFDVSLMQSFQKKLDYDLIILHYGTNVLNFGTKNYNWYSKSMTKTVNRLKECFPGTTILVISTADKSSKYNLEMKTDSAVVPLSQAQKQYAYKTGSGFINLYQLMGGNGSMAKWVDGEVALANKDYTHFNYRGAKKIAGMLFQEIDKGYEKYKVLRSKSTIKAVNSEPNQEIPADTITPNNEGTNE